MHSGLFWTWCAATPTSCSCCWAVELVALFAPRGNVESGEVCTVELSGEGAPLVVVGATDGDPLVVTGGWVHPVGRHEVVGVAQRLRRPAVGLTVEELGGEEL